MPRNGGLISHAFVLEMEDWRRRAGLNRRIKVLQTSALPLGYAAEVGFESHILAEAP